MIRRVAASEQLGGHQRDAERRAIRDAAPPTSWMSYREVAQKYIGVLLSATSEVVCLVTWCSLDSRAHSLRASRLSGLPGQPLERLPVFVEQQRLDALER